MQKLSNNYGSIYTNYPLTLPTAAGIRTQNFALTRAVAVTTSQFTFQSQVHQHQEEFWQAVVNLHLCLEQCKSLVIFFVTIKE